MKASPIPKEARPRRRAASTPKVATARKRVAIYTRKSVERGLDQEFNSLDAQRASILGYIQARAHDGWVAVDVAYDDGGFSGATTNRPAFERMMADARAHRIDVIAVYKLDRLSRSSIDLMQLLQEFETLGIEFVSVTQHFDTTTSMGRFGLHLIGLVAQLEREMISERTADKIRATRMNGLWTGGHAPFGFKVIEKRLHPDEENVERARSLFTLYLELGCLSATVTELNRRGWKTVRGSNWSKAGLHHILRNPTYIGRIPLHGEDFEGQHDGIIEPEVFEKVQVMLKSQSPDSKLETRNKWEMLLRGTLFCAACDRPMQHSYAANGNQRRHYYRCESHSGSDRPRCPKSSIAAPIIEDFVIERLRLRCQDKRIIAASLKKTEAAAKLEIPPLRKELTAIRREAAQVARQREKLVILLAEDQTDPSATRAKLGALKDDAARLSQREREIEEEIAGIEDGPARAEQLRRAVEEFLPLWEQLTIRERITALRLLVERVVYDGRESEVEIVYRDLDCGDASEAG